MPLPDVLARAAEAAAAKAGIPIEEFLARVAAKQSTKFAAPLEEAIAKASRPAVEAAPEALLSAFRGMEPEGVQGAKGIRQIIGEVRAEQAPAISTRTFNPTPPSALAAEEARAASAVRSQVPIEGRQVIPITVEDELGHRNIEMMPPKQWQEAKTKFHLAYSRMGPNTYVPPGAGKDKYFGQFMDQAQLLANNLDEASLVSQNPAEASKLASMADRLNRRMLMIAHDAQSGISAFRAEGPVPARGTANVNDMRELVDMTDQARKMFERPFFTREEAAANRLQQLMKQPLQGPETEALTAAKEKVARSEAERMALIQKRKSQVEGASFPIKSKARESLKARGLGTVEGDLAKEQQRIHELERLGISTSEEKRIGGMPGTKGSKLVKTKLQKQPPPTMGEGSSEESFEPVRKGEPGVRIYTTYRSEPKGKQFVGYRGTRGYDATTEEFLRRLGVKGKKK